MKALLGERKRDKCPNVAEAIPGIRMPPSVRMTPHEALIARRSPGPAQNPVSTQAALHRKPNA